MGGIGMAKTYYELVGSVYDKYDKRHPYHDEEAIYIENVSLTSLEEIDAFTAGKLAINFSSFLPSKYRDKNQFAIRSSAGSKSYYQKVIFGQPELVDIIAGISKRSITTPKGPRTMKLVPLHFQLTQQVIYPLKTALETRNRDSLQALLPEGSDFALRVRQYLNMDQSDPYTGMLLTNLLDEARNYPMFRKLLVQRMKANTNTIQKTSSNPRKVKEPKKTTTVSYPEFDDTDYAKHYTHWYNQLNEEKEEFLSEEELDKAISYNDEGPAKRGRS